MSGPWRCHMASAHHTLFRMRHACSHMTSVSADHTGTRDEYRRRHSVHHLVLITGNSGRSYAVQVGCCCLHIRPKVGSRKGRRSLTEDCTTFCVSHIVIYRTAPRFAFYRACCCLSVSETLFSGACCCLTRGERRWGVRRLPRARHVAQWLRMRRVSGRGRCLTCIFRTCNCPPECSMPLRLSARRPGFRERHCATGYYHAADAGDEHRQR